MSGEVVLTEDDDGGSFHVAAGGVLRFSLPETPTTGYRWEVESPPRERFSVIKDQFSPGAARPGAAGTRTIVLQPGSAGHFRFVLGLTRPWEPQANPVRTISVDVRAE